MSKITLNKVTLVAMTSVNIDETVKSLLFSSNEIDFYQILLISDVRPNNLPNKITHKQCRRMSNIDEWNYSIIYELYKYIESEYIILIHDDGFIVNPKSWRDEFLNYDYIGAAWDHNHFIDKNGNKIRVGNSVSLRSKKLLEIPSKFNMPWILHDGNFNEDTQICVWNRNLFLDNGIKFAEFDVAKYFSHETYFSEYEGINPFCFHNFGGLNYKYKSLLDSFDVKN